MSKNTLTLEQTQELLQTLRTRFEKNMNRHKASKWTDVEAKLQKSPEKLWTIHQMETTGGEPDVVDFGGKSSEYAFADCSPETPAGRRSYCFDAAALASRKENKPKNSAMGCAQEMDIAILTEEEYRKLQEFGEFDLKTSSWIATPAEIRKLGGALFCDRRYDQVFVYHNGAESYYGARAFRGYVKI